MLFLGFYIGVALVALVWVASDVNATSVFEIFQRWLHGTARGMGMYWEWLFYCFWRCVLLFTLVTLNLAVAYWTLEQNSFNLGQFARGVAFGFMLVGALAIFSFPHLSAYLRFRRQLNSIADELAVLVSLATSEKQFLLHFEPADYKTDAGWTAWYPKDGEWQEHKYWNEIIPVLYLRRETAPSIIVSVDWEHFLAWKLPSGSAIPGHCLPIFGPAETAFHVKNVRELKGHPGWSVISADMEDEAA